jgi:hypothetical protein
MQQTPRIDEPMRLDAGWTRRPYEMRPALGARKPQMVFTTVDLPAPFRADEPAHPPGVHLERDLAQHVDVLRVARGDAVQLEQRSCMAAAPEVRLDHRRRP